MVLGVALGVVLAIMRLSPNPILSSAAWVYLWIFRGTPVYTQLVFWGLISVLYPTIASGSRSGPEFASFETTKVITFFVAARDRAGPQRGGVHGRDRARRHPLRRMRARPRRRRRWA